MASTSSVGTMHSHFGAPSPAPSHFDAMSSRRSSVSASNTGKHLERQVFRWTNLRNIGHQIYTSKAATKASAILGAPTIGSPTVLAANGLICVGTDEGKICVYDFKQTLICVCGSDVTGQSIPTQPIPLLTRIQAKHTGPSPLWRCLSITPSSHVAIQLGISSCSISKIPKSQLELSHLPLLLPSPPAGKRAISKALGLSV